MADTVEEQQKRFPVLEMGMTGDCLKIRLADDQANLKVAIPKGMVEAWFAKWQEFQDGTATQSPLIGRWYTGEWEKADALFPL
jgi:hypothetical protein